MSIVAKSSEGLGMPLSGLGFLFHAALRLSTIGSDLHVGKILCNLKIEWNVVIVYS